MANTDEATFSVWQLPVDIWEEISRFVDKPGYAAIAETCATGRDIIARRHWKSVRFIDTQMILSSSLRFFLHKHGDQDDNAIRMRDFRSHIR